MADLRSWKERSPLKETTSWGPEELALSAPLSWGACSGGSGWRRMWRGRQPDLRKWKALTEMWENKGEVKWGVSIHAGKTGRQKKQPCPEGHPGGVQVARGEKSKREGSNTASWPGSSCSDHHSPNGCGGLWELFLKQFKAGRKWI